MAQKTSQFFGKSFDEGTLTKLELFKLYATEWFSTLVVSNVPNIKQLTIYDFFAGQGSDSNHHDGSPIIICDVINKFLTSGHSGINKNLKITVKCSDAEEENVKNLKNLILQKNYSGFDVVVEHSDFVSAFTKNVDNLASKNEASLVFLDQFGIKDVNANMFEKIVNCPNTDFIMFVSSNFLKRFWENEAIYQYFPHLKEEDIACFRETPPYLIHRCALEKIYKPLVGERKYYLAPFSIRKKSNVYGLIFGSAHILGLQKFQKSCWNISPDFGDANFNIDNDFNVDADMTLFYNASKSEKILDFEKKLTSFIKSREYVTNYDVLLFGLKAGFSIKKIQEALISINESLKLELGGLDGYKPTNKTFGITEKTYQQKKLSYIKISQ